ncbi:LysR family transcriptional regulator [Vulgatibacter sp.]|uniref:LysR family transcriptional regulator n=1 Tax=Vulgatibacter sp. TaxID=1971226 RepID=UPI00356AF2D0
MKTNGESPWLGDLAVFAAVAEAEGFSAAARRLGVSKAMVSTAVARLEARLGVRLFQRTTRRLSLTEAGRAALPHVQRALLAAQDAEEAAAQLRTSPRGTLRINAPMSFGLLHVVPALGDFAREYPEVRIDLVLDDRVLDLVEGGFDLAVRIGTLPDSALVAQRVGTSRNALVAHPDYLARRGTPTVPADLAGHDALLYSLASTGSDWALSRGAQTEVVRMRGPLQANSSLALRQAALQGLGIARMPLFAVGEDLASGRLRRVLADWQLPEHGIHAITTAREHLPPKTRAFVDFFRTRIGEPAYWERI